MAEPNSTEDYWNDLSGAQQIYPSFNPCYFIAAALNLM